ncbi:SoxR reducing system RseC family protein [Aliiglaciecola sp. 3_MG-2023]|uniref:SoxR reducing system RseC family protein n=1 Tax=Aliiglaciecola sp. 3_MG-2023 TaxID=3062644 RepID=UPI0026E45669|nr:SoxR reducing system RseC family protein [Aliiglaciecola sp. 3_MG-2023]MDO6691836.1 SoxR reducing system RseC family protein [Aliiglaciecola sp. 3_MG-2023]
MIEEIGVITAVDKDHIWVETEIKSTCGGCQAQDNCGTGVVAKAFTPKKEQLILRCHHTAKVGQKVKLGVAESQLLTASAMMYLLPLLVMIVTALSGQYLLPLMDLQHELWIVGAAFITTFLTFRFLKKYANQPHTNRFQPKLLAILPAQEDPVLADSKGQTQY